MISMNEFSKEELELHKSYMKQAIELAKKAVGHTSPNPYVGCVVVKDGRVISTGYHEQYGQFHAERNALMKLTEDAAGADLYVTLEPCCHQGKTPPCTEIIIENKIGRVFVGSMDTNPLVGGKGVRLLEEAGIKVYGTLLEEECVSMNEVFFHYIGCQMPFVAMKYAMTLDGKIACASGDSKWVTADGTRQHVQELRNRYKGIMVGIGTVLADDPMLNCRMEGGVSPVRIICDTNLRIPMDCKIVETANELSTIVACSKDVYEQQQDKIASLQTKQVEIIALNVDSEGICLKELLIELGKRKIDGILLEGGGILNSSMLKQGLIQKVYAYVAPKLIGGKDAKSPVEGDGCTLMKDAVQLDKVSTTMLGEDILITGYVR